MIDTHAHLDDARLNSKNIINNMSKDNIDRIITIGTSVDDFQKIIEITETDDKVFACLGFHPYYAEEVNERNLKILENYSKNKKVVGIGEFGLDFNTTTPDKESQIDAFIQQLKLASKLNMPACLHVRDAHKEAIELLKCFKKNNDIYGVIHCFTGDISNVKEYINLGFFISLSGSITYKKSNKDIIKSIPLDKIILETDCPYLAPQAVRGTVNEPKNVRLTAQFVADTLEMSVEKLEKITDENTFRLFKKLK